MWRVSDPAVQLAHPWRGDVTSSPARGLGLAIMGPVVTGRSQLRLLSSWPERCPVMPGGHLSNGTDMLAEELGGGTKGRGEGLVGVLVGWKPPWG